MSTAGSSAEAGRLRWRCRRGMRELDQLLGGYLAQSYPHADAPTQAAFASLLEQQDPEIWSWLTGGARASKPEWQRIVDAIRARDHV